MDEFLFYILVALIVTAIIGILTYMAMANDDGKTEDSPNEQENEPAVRPRPRPLIDVGAGGDGPRNRAAAMRNARARMRVAQAQRQTHHSESEDEVQDLEEDIVLPDGKIGKKKLAKLQLKAEKKSMREAEEREREEKKEREEIKAEKRREIEKEREEEEAKKEEEERINREEKERKEQEEYDQMKVQFEVEEEGFDEDDQDEHQQKNLLKEFLDYIMKNKVVVLEDLAALFRLKTQSVIDRITELQKEGTLTGVIDDRGKFIYISQSELENVARFIRQRGRVSISDLAEASNELINLQPEATVEA